VRGSFTVFLADCGRLFLRNLRVMGLGIVFASALGWGIDVLRSQFREWMYDLDPGAVAIPLLVFDVRWVHIVDLGSYAAGLVFLMLVFASKIAMAHLAVHDKRSALIAWGVGLGKLLRSPLRSTLALVLLAASWIGASHALGILTVQFLEVEQNLWLGLLFGQLTMIWGAAILIATLITARRFVAVPAVQSRDGSGAATEPIVEVPRGKPARATPPKTAATAVSGARR
jgi:hypothetical protein